jgi:bifunctional UDP-N-acetylglucosamine pyrophosphorylase/glucosamine-1-phosphate N-acetyltransferase
MQAVILAAGKSTRTYPLTLTRPKPLLRVVNQTVIEHNLDQLSGLVDEVIVVVGYKAEMIRDFLGEERDGIHIKYVLQEDTSGTASAVGKAREHIRGKFLLMYGDDLYSGDDLRRLLEYENAILAQRVDNPSNFGVLRTEGDKFLEVIEKPQQFISDLVSIGCFVFSDKIFSVLDGIELSRRGEYEFTDAYNLLGKTEEIRVVTVEDYWLPITYPWSLLHANACLARRIRGKVDSGAVVEPGATLKGEVVVGAGTVIKNGAYIEGPVIIGENCVIGPNAYLRGGTTIGSHCHIGQAVEIKNSVIGDNTNVAHLSYVGDSILGEKVNLGAGTITANLRHDGKTIKSQVGEQVLDSGLLKLGAVIGDEAKTGVHTSFYPGVKLGPGSTTLPGDIIKRDLSN